MFVISHQIMIKTINSWRGLAALNVVMFHCGTGIWSAGQSGVVFFFLSSAFLLAMKYPFDSLTARQYGRFFLNRAARIYPLHWLAMALMIIITLTLIGDKVKWGSAILNMLLIQSWFPQHDESDRRLTGARLKEKLILFGPAFSCNSVLTIV